MERKKILRAVGGIGRVLTDVIPNLELIIGCQPTVPELGGVEAQNRFNYVFLEFVKAITSKEHPLVVFLDDLQWIEEASLKLLETVMTGSGVSSVLFIGAYRDNEVDGQRLLRIYAGRSPLRDRRDRRADGASDGRCRPLR
jgi:histidine kinase